MNKIDSNKSILKHIATKRKACQYELKFFICMGRQWAINEI